MKRSLIVVMVLIAFVLLPQSNAACQEPEPTETPAPTVTPTPAYVQEVPLTSGNTLKLERAIDYGDIAVVVMLLVHWITFVLANAVKIPRLFTQR